MPRERIDPEDFRRVDMRVGRVLAAEEHLEARTPAYALEIDFGPELGTLRSSAQITHYPREGLVGRLVVGCVNLPPLRVAGLRSEALVLGGLDPERGVVLLQPDGECEPGSRIA